MMPERRAADATAHKEITERLSAVQVDVDGLKGELLEHIHPEIEQLLAGQEEIASELLGPQRSELLGGGRDASKGIVHQAAEERKRLDKKIAALQKTSLSTSERITLLGILLASLASVWQEFFAS